MSSINGWEAADSRTAIHAAMFRSGNDMIVQHDASVAAHKGMLSRSGNTERPRPTLQRTPRRGRIVMAILKGDSSFIVVPIYRCGAAKHQAVGRQSISALQWILLVTIW